MGAAAVHEQNIVPQVPLTFEAFLEWMDEDTHAEWAYGEIIMAPPPTIRHQRIALFLGHLLGAYLDRRLLGEVIISPVLVKLNPDLGREPDLIFIAEEHMDRYTETYLDGPPDIAVEIVSPGSGLRDRGEKFHEYEAAGVREYWFIDPLRTEANLYQLDDDARYHPAKPDAAGRLHSAVLPGFWLDPAWLWREPPPSYSEAGAFVAQMLDTPKHKKKG